MDNTRRKEWLEGHTSESPIELIGKLATYDEDSILLAFEQAIQRKFHRDGRSILSEVEYHILAMCALDREVKNGGYLQFFENSSRIFAKDIIVALESAGAMEFAEITKDAIAALKLPCPPNEESLDFILQIDNELRDERLGECDLRYYGQNSGIRDIALAYLSGKISEVEFSIMGVDKMERARKRAEQAVGSNDGQAR